MCPFSSLMEYICHDTKVFNCIFSVFHFKFSRAHKCSLDSISLCCCRKSLQCQVRLVTYAYRKEISPQTLNDMFLESIIYNFCIIIITSSDLLKGYGQKSYFSEHKCREHNHRSSERTLPGILRT